MATDQPTDADHWEHYAADQRDDQTRLLAQIASSVRTIRTILVVWAILTAIPLLILLVRISQGA